MFQLAGALETGEIAAPADGPVSWTAHADLAEVAARSLAQETMHPGARPPLTAGEAPDLADVAERLSGRTRRYRPAHED